MKVGFIGLGVMGKRMAQNILKNDYSMIVFDVDENVVQEFVDQGAEKASSPAEAAATADVVLTSLPNDSIVKKVILGESGVLEGAKENTVLIDLSSIPPKAIREVADQATKQGVEVIDAPVSGGAAGAEKGTLTVMVGGKSDVVDQARPVLNCICNKIFHVGDVGAGDTLKLVNNLMLGANMLIASEAMALGTKAGLDPDVLFEVISESSGRSYALEAKYPKFISQGNFDPGFSIDLEYKDLELAISTAKDMNMPLIMGNLTQQLYEAARCEGLGDRDISAMINMYEKWTGTKVRKDDEK
ncbi:3-hydroxyisobutyrate dehydrogenase [Natranaerobius thermophilus JW/NM-WN-LF]|uniref:3-hydroxyisobutyrate dehydrogenase n=1 Tax=Natranaerobius thermophilus (strain ATCC BAA-1301 / DSM 18059 / JW/NM-WN-LF) TaxID=457570 RepID=B2A7L8_NATTJ|nr:3-hydroxyisobutyrate dehydrogenase [Natranaerobius thermophilus JW/NM-WN-LF]